MPQTSPTSPGLIDEDFIKELVSYEASGLLTPHEVLLYSLEFPDAREKQAMRDELQARAQSRKAVWRQLTCEVVLTREQSDRREQSWCAWLKSNPMRWAVGRTEKEAVARLWWYQGLLSAKELEVAQK